MQRFTHAKSGAMRISYLTIFDNLTVRALPHGCSIYLMIAICRRRYLTVSQSATIPLWRNIHAGIAAFPVIFSTVFSRHFPARFPMPFPYHRVPLRRYSKLLFSAIAVVKETRGSRGKKCAIRNARPVNRDRSWTGSPIPCRSSTRHEPVRRQLRKLALEHGLGCGTTGVGAGIEHGAGRTDLENQPSVPRTGRGQCTIERTRVARRTGRYLQPALLRGALPTSLAETNAEQRTLSVLMMDIDHFRRFNDIVGHLRGDECLDPLRYGIRCSTGNPR
jgi:hypothetical protein